MSEKPCAPPERFGGVLFFTAMNANRPKARNDASTAAIMGGFGYF